eukprot:scaffold1538_cov109-Cylindrotheca_fusiformis.AAC.4
MTNDGIIVNDVDEAYRQNDRLWRLFRFMMGVLAFYSLLLFLDYEHDTILMILGIGCFLLWIMYMLVVVFLLGCNSSVPLEAEERGLTIVEQAEDSLTSSSDAFPFSFAETPQQIRSCQEPTIPGESPKSGAYEIVYNAVVFGRSVRSQGKLILQFHAEPNGWSITGSNETVSGSRPIAEGFLNSIGQMYWIISEAVDPCVYRGIFEMSTCTMFDGEFQSIGDHSNANGWIARLEKLSDEGGVATRSTVSPTSSPETKMMEMVNISKEQDSVV